MGRLKIDYWQWLKELVLKEEVWSCADNEVRGSMCAFFQHLKIPLMLERDKRSTPAEVSENIGKWLLGPDSDLEFDSKGSSVYDLSIKFYGGVGIGCHSSRSMRAIRDLLYVSYRYDSALRETKSAPLLEAFIEKMQSDLQVNNKEIIATYKVQSKHCQLAVKRAWQFIPPIQYVAHLPVELPQERVEVEVLDSASDSDSDSDSDAEDSPTYRNCVRILIVACGAFLSLGKTFKKQFCINQFLDLLDACDSEPGSHPFLKPKEWMPNQIFKDFTVIRALMAGDKEVYAKYLPGEDEKALTYCHSKVSFIMSIILMGLKKSCKSRLLNQKSSSRKRGSVIEKVALAKKRSAVEMDACAAPSNGACASKMGLLSLKAVKSPSLESPLVKRNRKSVRWAEPVDDRCLSRS